MLERRLKDLGLVLPEPPRMPVGVVTAFSWVRVVGDRVLVSGHGPQNLDGSPAGPFGRVPTEVGLELAAKSARLAALSVLASVRAAIGDLDLVTAWVTVTGFVQAEPGYAQTTRSGQRILRRDPRRVRGGGRSARQNRDRRGGAAAEPARRRRRRAPVPDAVIARTLQTRVHPRRTHRVRGRRRGASHVPG